jgi:hypothetical protein
MSTRGIFWAGALAAVLLPADAWAVDITERCENDQLSTPETVNGRNLWALTCHLISKMDYDCAIANGYYWTFNSTVGGSNVAPTRPGQSCAGFRRFTMCPAGCFEASQRVAFGARYAPPSRAFAEEVGAVTTLAVDARTDHLTFRQSAIRTYVRGRETADLIKISVGPRQIVVTRNHPMVSAAGMVVSADTVGVGDALLMADGPAVVDHVERLPYDGLVWNIKPESAEYKANVLVAEGFLTGSVRFQNEWADEAARLALRQSLDDR